MEKKTFTDLDLEIYEEVLDNGFKIYIHKMDRNKIDARITVNFGSDITSFTKDGKLIDLPFGTAHFLEHKMFNKKDINISSLYEQNGAFGNAYTDNLSTVYYFSSPDNFYENLDILLKCVANPHFTEENIAKEKPIIIEELKATLSDPEMLAFYKSRNNTFHTKSYQSPVLGSIKSIENMTKEDLYNAYNNFYVPSNMHLLVTGNVDAKKVCEFVKKHFKNKGVKANPISNKEPKEILKEKEIINKDINNKLCFITYKIDISKFNKGFEFTRYLNILLINKFSSLSGFNDITFKEKTILSPVYFMMEIKDNYACFMFEAEVTDENKLIELIDNELKNLYITKEDIELIKKSWINSYIINLDNVIDSSEIINEFIIKYGKIIYDIIPIIKSLNSEKANKIFKKLDFSNKSIVIVEKSK